jgi:hypothetical protein
VLFLECLGEDDKRCEICGIYGIDKKCMQNLGVENVKRDCFENEHNICIVNGIIISKLILV